MAQKQMINQKISDFSVLDFTNYRKSRLNKTKNNGIKPDKKSNTK